MAKEVQDARKAGFEAVRTSLTLEALEQRILLSNPAIGFVSDSPDPVNQGSTLTLIAQQRGGAEGDPRPSRVCSSTAARTTWPIR